MKLKTAKLFGEKYDSKTGIYVFVCNTEGRIIFKYRDLEELLPDCDFEFEHIIVEDDDNIIWDKIYGTKLLFFYNITRSLQRFVFAFWANNISSYRMIGEITKDT